MCENDIKSQLSDEAIICPSHCTKITFRIQLLEPTNALIPPSLCALHESLKCFNEKRESSEDMYFLPCKKRDKKSLSLINGSLQLKPRFPPATIRLTELEIDQN